MPRQRVNAPGLDTRRSVLMPSKSTTLTAREILRLEYGDSRNFLTPIVHVRGTLAPCIAYELSSGEGLERGSRIFGVSIVRVNDDGTTDRDHDASACFSSMSAATQYVDKLRAIESARQEGYDAGVAAGSWLLDGNSSEDEARALLRGLDDGDPAVLDSLPASPLSGEWADAPTPADVLDWFDVEEDDDCAEAVLSAYEEAFSRGVEDEAYRSARAMLGE
jgi:hypothetical protein